MAEWRRLLAGTKSSKISAAISGRFPLSPLTYHRRRNHAPHCSGCGL